MAYSKTVWQNNRPPAINAENLNKIENALESHDTSIGTLTTQVGDLSDLDTTTKTDLVSAINEVAQNTVTVDSALSSTSTNPVQNKVINTALSGKADASAVPSITASAIPPTAATLTFTVNGYSYQIDDNGKMDTYLQNQYVQLNSVRSSVVANDTDPVNSVAVIAYINSLDATNTSY